MAENLMISSGSILGDNAEPFDSSCVEIPALGRPFNLGMLYDSREDKILPGLTLWDKEKLEEDIRVTPKHNTEYTESSSKSIADKCSLLEIDTSLKTSIWTGLINIEGSAKYFNDSKASKDQASITFKSKTVTEFKELTMNHLGKDNIKYWDVIKKGLATHVVAAIQYGAQSFFVFNQDVSTHENTCNIEGKLEVKVNKIPSLIKGNGKNAETVKTGKYHCKFYGDCCPEQIPKTFEDVHKVCQEISKLLGPNGERAVPLKVWLMPLTFFDPTAAQLVTQLSVRLESHIEKIMEGFSMILAECNDISRCESAQTFPQIFQKIKMFDDICSEFVKGLQREIKKKVPRIRGGKEDESELIEFLNRQATSPFQRNALKKWLDFCRMEVCFLSSLTEILPNTKIVQPEYLQSEICGKGNVLCYVFYLTEAEDDPYLSALENYLKGIHSGQSWSQDFEEERIFDQIRKKAKLFRDFAENNKDDENCRFLAVCLSDNKCKGSAIRIYKDGCKAVNFTPPSKPEKVSVDEIKDNSGILRFSPPQDGARAVIGYRVEYSVAGTNKWHHQMEHNAGEVKVDDLNPYKGYTFRVRACTDVGVGPAAEVKTSPKKSWWNSIWKLLFEFMALLRYTAW